MATTHNDEKNNKNWGGVFKTCNEGVIILKEVLWYWMIMFNGQYGLYI